MCKDNKKIQSEQVTFYCIIQGPDKSLSHLNYNKQRRCITSHNQRKIYSKDKGKIDSRDKGFKPEEYAYY